MTAVSLEIPSPLNACIAFCEVECVAACCGIAAFSTDPALIAAWCGEVGSDAALEARIQLVEVIEVVENRTNLVTSMSLNHHTVNDDARRQLLDFLAAFDSGLAAAEPT